MKKDQARQYMLQHRKGLTVAGVSLLIGGITAVSMHAYLEGQAQQLEQRYQGTLVPVVVARIDLQPGTTLKEDMLAARKVPADFAMSTSISPDNYETVLGKTISHPIRKGDQITYAAVEGPKASTFSARVGKGRRAITVPVDEINSISGMLEPDDRIDLIASHDGDGGGGAYPFLQQVRVLATGQRTVSDPKTGEQRQYSTVTLDTSPEEAQRIIAVRERGRLSALLRNPQDTEQIGVPSRVAPAVHKVFRSPVTVKRPVPILYGGTR
jgi:pilus assembly protein CpaB